MRCCKSQDIFLTVPNSQLKADLAFPTTGMPVITTNFEGGILVIVRVAVLKLMGHEITCSLVLLFMLASHIYRDVIWAKFLSSPFLNSISCKVKRFCYTLL